MTEPASGRSPAGPPSGVQPSATQPVAAAQPVPEGGGSGVGAALIGAGILLSRLIGLFRNTLMARYLGAGVAADAFHAGFRIPNLLQNLFGDGALSAAFVPVYSSLLGRGEEEEARKLASSVASLLALVTAALVLIGVLAAPLLVTLINPGYEGERRELTIYITRLLFPGAAIFVLSAWTLGILSSHRRFFAGYVAPVAWNAAMIAALLWYGPRGAAAREIAIYLAIASVVGAVLQVLVQAPLAWRLAGGVRARIVQTDALAKVKRGFAPVAVSRGAVQISTFIDQSIASLLPTGAFSMVAYAQLIYMLPVSLFGMSVSASELTEMSRESGSGPEAHRRILSRLDAGLRRIAYFVVPCIAAFVLLGDVVIAALLQSGRFGPTETRFTWGILAAASVGLLAATLSRLYSSTFYALHDTKTPFRIALVRIAVGTVLAALFALVLTPRLAIDQRWGAAGLTLGSALAAWVEMSLLRRRLGMVIGTTPVPAGFLARVAGAALAAGATGLLLESLMDDAHRFLLAAVVFTGFGAVYLALTHAGGVAEARALTRRVLGRFRR